MLRQDGRLSGALVADLLRRLGATAGADLGGTTNVNVLLADPPGVVLRIYGPWVTRRRLLAVRDLRGRLAALGLRVPAPVRPAGRDVIRAFDRWAELETYLPHAPASPDRAEEVCEALGLLHRALVRCEPCPLPPPALPNYATVRQMRAWLRATEAGHARRAPPPSLLELARSALSRFGCLLRRHRSALPAGLVHGDYTPANLGLAAGGAPVFLDFDLASTRPRLHDLASAVRDVLGEGIDSTVATAAAMARMAAAYDRAAPFPLTSDERLALPVEVARLWLCSAVRAGFPSVVDDPWSDLASSLAHAEAAMELARPG